VHGALEAGHSQPWPGDWASASRPQLYRRYSCLTKERAEARCFPSPEYSIDHWEIWLPEVDVQLPDLLPYPHSSWWCVFLLIWKTEVFRRDLPWAHSTSIHLNGFSLTHLLPWPFQDKWPAPSCKVTYSKLVTRAPWADLTRHHSLVGEEDRHLESEDQWASRHSLDPTGCTALVLGSVLCSIKSLSYLCPC
jgi:hypothetical protein